MILWSPRNFRTAVENLAAADERKDGGSDAFIMLEPVVWTFLEILRQTSENSMHDLLLVLNPSASVQHFLHQSVFLLKLLSHHQNHWKSFTQVYVRGFWQNQTHLGKSPLTPCYLLGTSFFAYWIDWGSQKSESHFPRLLFALKQAIKETCPTFSTRH